jgi:site-specific recombinase XerD
VTQTFAEWLRAANYRASTADASVKQLGRLREAHAAQESIPAYCADSARRALTWIRANYGSLQTEDALGRYLMEQGVQPVTHTLRAKPRQRVWPARSFDDADWDKFRDALYASEDPRDRVLDVMCLTGIRVGDALRLPTTAIARGIKVGEIELERKGGTWVTLPVGVAEPWQRLLDQLLDAQAPTVAALLSPEHPSPLPGKAPYLQINRRLKAWQTELALSGRIHTHKIRRTFAVKLYGLTKDLLAVQQGLNNGAQATMKYLDESRTSTIADYQRDLQQRRATK